MDKSANVTPDPYNDFGDGEYPKDETLQETNEVNQALENLLNTPSERTFKSALRMSPSAFEKLLELIKEDYIFFDGIQPDDYLNNEFITASFYGLTQSIVSRWCACVGYALIRLPDHFLDDLEPTEKRAIKKVVSAAKGTSASANRAKKARH